MDQVRSKTVKVEEIVPDFDISTCVEPNSSFTGVLQMKHAEDCLQANMCIVIGHTHMGATCGQQKKKSYAKW